MLKLNMYLTIVRVKSDGENGGSSSRLVGVADRSSEKIRSRPEKPMGRTKYAA
jgi:hypothetical protein